MINLDDSTVGITIEPKMLLSFYWRGKLHIPTFYVQTVASFFVSRNLGALSAGVFGNFGRMTSIWRAKFYVVGTVWYCH